MAVTGLTTFDKTVHQTNRWLNDVRDSLGWGDRQQAYHALRAVLHALRDRLTVGEVAQLGAQLPMLVRGLYFEGWHPRADGFGRGPRHRDAFLAGIAAEYAVAPAQVDPAELARAVFATLERHVAEGEIEDVRRILPEEIRGLWPRPARSS